MMDVLRRSHVRHVHAAMLQKDGGYTLVELLVAAALVIGLSALTVSALADARTVLAVAGERGEVQQRARAAMEAIVSGVRGAGVGSDRGRLVGPLVRWLPPVWPGRPGGSADEFSTAVTAIGVLGTIPPATLAFDVPAGTTTLDFDRAGCALPCGFFDRMRVLLVDARGDFDIFVLTDTDGASATVRRLSGGTGASYARGTPVLPVDLQTHYANARARELRTHDGDRSDLPVASDVVDLRFEYLADPRPPAEPRPPPGEENCLYDSTGAPRGLPVLPQSGGSLATMSAAMLTDGPWCGRGAEPFDADLLRIRVVRVTLRLQAVSAVHRGTDALWFRNPGTATRAAQMVKDIIVSGTVVPPNLGGWR